MSDIKITIEAPSLTDALNNLAEALRGRKTDAVSTVTEVVTEVKDTSEKSPEQPVEAPEKATQLQSDTTYVSNAPKAPDPVQTTTSPVKEENHYSFQDIKNLGAVLLEADKLAFLSGVLAEYGIQTVSQLKPEQYDEVAMKLESVCNAL